MTTPITTPAPAPYLTNADVIALLSTYPPDAQVGIVSLDSDYRYVIDSIVFDPQPTVTVGTSGRVSKPSIRFAAYLSD